MSILALLDQPLDELSDEAQNVWFDRVSSSFQQNAPDWVRAVSVLDHLDDGRAWQLLGWVEMSADIVARERSGRTLSLAAFAVSLLMTSRLDRRDISVVCALLRRGALISGADFVERIEEGCRLAGHIGEDGLDLLLSASSEVPSTHVESGSGSSFEFTRRPADFDVADLERWLEGES